MTTRRCLYLSTLFLSLVLGELSACGEAVVRLPADPRDEDLAGVDMRRRADMSALEPDLGAQDMAPDQRHSDDLGLDMAAAQDQGPAQPDMTPDPVGVSCSVDGVMGTCLDTADCTGDRVSTPNRCPGPANIQCCTIKPQDPPPMPGVCDPSAMPRPNEGLSEAPGQAGCPAGMVAMSATMCIDQYEAALVEIMSDGSERSWSPYFNPGQKMVRAVSIAQAIPQGYISGDQAQAACVNAGKRLCTSQEWLSACQGAQGWTYPYGATLMPGTCHDARAKHPVVEYFNSTDPSIWSKLGHPCINQQADTVLRGNAKPGCVSPAGAFHMMGNLHEWVADASGTFRGGFYADTSRNGPGCLYKTTAHNRQHWDYSTGFRCCASR